MSTERELWLKLCQNIQRLDDCHKTGDLAIAKVNKIHAKLSKTDKFTTKVAQKLVESYKDVLARTAAEKKIIAEWMEHASILMALTEASETGLETKRKKRKPEEKHSTSSKRSKTDDSGGFVPLTMGSKVVVPRPQQNDHILANVVKWLPDKQKYEVEDAEDDEENPGTRKCYLFPAKMVIPLPTQVDSTKEFPEGHTVLALYPGTSCFYKAIVQSPPSKTNDVDYKMLYAIRFEDDGDFDRYVDPVNVLDYPKPSGRKRMNFT
ncbi:SGF29 tudor-like domain-containing protein [Zopfochytrium polystomum]|nr:SGF29 tudor-like domain-containing protein [Zopfochytrium polystomum]